MGHFFKINPFPFLILGKNARRNKKRAHHLCVFPHFFLMVCAPLNFPKRRKRSSQFSGVLPWRPTGACVANTDCHGCGAISRSGTKYCHLVPTTLSPQNGRAPKRVPSEIPSSSLRAHLHPVEVALLSACSLHAYRRLQGAESVRSRHPFAFPRRLPTPDLSPYYVGTMSGIRESCEEPL